MSIYWDLHQKLMGSILNLSSIQLRWNPWSIVFVWTCLINQQTNKRTVGWGHKLFVWRVFCGGQSFVSCLLVNNVSLSRCKIGKQATVATRCYLPPVPLFPPFVCLSLCSVCTTHPPRKQAPLSGQQNTWVLQFTVRLLLRLGKREKKNGWGFEEIELLRYEGQAGVFVLVFNWVL